MLACAVVKTTAAQSLPFVYNALRMAENVGQQGSKVEGCPAEAYQEKIMSLL